MSDTKVQRLVVVGEGLAGTMAAAALARALLRSRFIVTLVATGREDDSLGLVEAADLARPELRRFHEFISLGEEQLVQEAGATYSLGTAWTGWSSLWPTIFLPFGSAGAALGGVAFHQLAARLRAAGRKVRLGDYAAGALMAQAGRFAPPPSDPRNPLWEVAYGLHLPRAGHRQLVLQRAREFGIAQPRARFAGVEIDSEGLVTSVRLDDGTALGGDLFVDATGPATLLASALQGKKRVSWLRWLRADRAITSEHASSVPPAPYGHVEKLEQGWRVQLPVQDGLSETLVYASADPEDGMEHSGGAGRPFEQGRIAQPWSGNVVAIGGAAALLEPQHGLGLHLVQEAIERLLKLIPVDARAAQPERHEYNRQLVDLLDRARDLVLAPYAAGRAQASDLPDELAAKLDLFRSRGRVPLLDGDLLEEPEWALLMDELGLRQRRYEALADAVPIERLEAQLARMREVLIAAIRPLPLHGDHLRQLRTRAAA